MKSFFAGLSMKALARRDSPAARQAALAAARAEHPAEHDPLSPFRNAATRRAGLRLQQDSIPLWQQDVTYSAESGLDHRARCWLVDIAENPSSWHPQVALVVCPLDTTGSGGRDYHLLLNRDSYRKNVGETLAQTITELSLPAPDLFVLVVHERYPDAEYGLAFPMKALGDFTRRVRLLAKDFGQVVGQLNTDGTLQAAERQLLREALATASRMRRTS